MSKEGWKAKFAAANVENAQLMMKFGGTAPHVAAFMTQAAMLAFENGYDLFESLMQLTNAHETGMDTTAAVHASCASVLAGMLACLEDRKCN